MRWVCLAISLPLSAQADALVATRLIPAQTVVAAEDVTVVDADIPDALSDPSAAVGQAARRVIYPGRPILARDLGPPVIVTRNARVELRFHADGLAISAEGRALDTGGAGQTVRVLSLSSKSVVEGRVSDDGSVLVGVP